MRLHETPAASTAKPAGAAKTTHVQVGPHLYEITLTDEPIIFKGKDCRGLCDPIKLSILIKASLQPSRRLEVFFHELAHAWQRELDIDRRNRHDEESFARLVAVGMMYLPPAEFARLHAFITKGGA